jgi:hypothetical protein
LKDLDLSLNDFITEGINTDNNELEIINICDISYGSINKSKSRSSSNSQCSSITCSSRSSYTESEEDDDEENEDESECELHAISNKATTFLAPPMVTNLSQRLTQPQQMKLETLNFKH